MHAENPHGLLQPGTFAEVHWNLPSDPNVIRIPTSALLFRQHGLEVAVVGPDDKVSLKPVSLGRNLDTDVEVLQGLSASDRVVDSPPDALASGDVVRIAGDQPPGIDETALRRSSHGASFRPVSPRQHIHENGFDGLEVGRGVIVSR